MKKIDGTFLDQVWAMRESELAIITEFIHQRPDSKDGSSKEAFFFRAKEREKMKYRVENGNAVIPVYGMILKNIPSWMDGGTSTRELSETIKQALQDKAVNTIILDIDSPGGSVSGVAEVSDLIFESRKVKPIHAYAQGLAASAAYWIAAAADKIYATKATEVGSIGVYSVATDMTVLAHNLGIKVEVIRAGKHKATGHPLKHMSDDDKALMQSQVNDYFDLFTSAIQEYRGMSQEDIEKVATGRTFMASEALALGLIDGIKEFVSGGASTGAATETNRGEVAAEAPTASLLNHEHTNQEEQTMDLSKLTFEQLSAARPDLVKQIQEDAAKSAAEAAKAAAAEDSKAEKEAAVLAERTRCATIVAKGNIKEYAGCSSVVQDAVLSGHSVAEAEGKMKDHRLSVLKNSGAPSAGSPEASLTENTDPYAGLSLNDRCAKQWADNFDGVQQAFNSLDQYKSFVSAKENGQARIFKKS